MGSKNAEKYFWGVLVLFILILPIACEDKPNYANSEDDYAEGERDNEEGQLDDAEDPNRNHDLQDVEHNQCDPQVGVTKENSTPQKPKYGKWTPLKTHIMVNNAKFSRRFNKRGTMNTWVDDTVSVEDGWQQIKKKRNCDVQKNYKNNQSTEKTNKLNKYYASHMKTYLVICQFLTCDLNVTLLNNNTFLLFCDLVTPLNNNTFEI